MSKKPSKELLKMVCIISKILEIIECYLKTKVMCFEKYSERYPNELPNINLFLFKMQTDINY